MSKLHSKKISSIGSQVSTIISVSLVLLIIGFILIVSSITNGANDSLRESVELVVRMKPGASTAQVDSLSDFLKHQPYVSSLHFTSAEDVLALERQYNAELLDMIGENPYSPEFDVFLRPSYVNSDSILRISARLLCSPFVDDVSSSTEVVDNINYFLKNATLYLYILGGVMILISLALIFNTVSLAVYSRRFVIHTMKLVGAKASFIRRPFVWSGILIGVVSALIASAVICALHFYSSAEQLEKIFFVDWLHTGALCGVLVLAGALFCGMAAFFAANRYIGYSYDSLYMK